MDYYNIDVVSVGFDNKDRTLVTMRYVSEDIAKLIIEKYGNAANRIFIYGVDVGDEE